jgi:hypothetical protein
MDSIMIGQMNEAQDLGIDVSEVGCNCHQQVSGDFLSNCVRGSEDDDLEIGFSFPNPIKALGQAFSQIEHNVEKVPVLKQVAHLAVSPIRVIKNIAKGERLDHVALGELRSQVKDVKELAPYAQTVISLVPGIGTGLSAAIGASLALVQGKRIDQALIEAVKGSLPGGPLAQTAFSVAAGVMEGKPIDEIALGALPIDQAAKDALLRGLQAAKDVAHGKPLNQIVMNQAMQGLPPSVAKALQVGTALGHAKFLQDLAHSGAAKFAANTLLKSGGINALQKVLANPTVRTAAGTVAIPGPLLLAVVRGGPKAAVEVAMNTLKDPHKSEAVRAAALMFSATTPPAVMYREVGKVVDALRSKDAQSAVKAAAQIAATEALAKSGSPEAIKAMDLINKAKDIAKRLPSASDLTNLTHGRVEVCGAKSEESRGVWLKSHIYRDGQFLCMTVYSVANADAEVFNFRLDLAPIMKKVVVMHKRMHGTSPVVGIGFGDVMNATAVKLGRAKLAQKAFSVSSHLAAKAACNVQTPNVPVSNAVLATYAAARAGVDAVDKNAKLKRAMESVGSNVAKLIAVKKHLASLSDAGRLAALKDPTIRAAILSGIGSKIALAKFVKSDGPKMARATRRNALIASRQFSTLAEKVKAGDPNAKKMAMVVSVAAKARAKTQQTVEQGTHGSHAGFVITAQGKVRRNPKGFVKRTPKEGERSEVLVRPHSAIETGVFDHVSGASGHYATRLRNRLEKIRKLAVINGVDEEELIGAVMTAAQKKAKRKKLLQLIRLKKLRAAKAKKVAHARAAAHAKAAHHHGHAHHHNAAVHHPAAHHGHHHPRQLTAAPMIRQATAQASQGPMSQPAESQSSYSPPEPSYPDRDYGGETDTYEEEAPQEEAPQEEAAPDESDESMSEMDDSSPDDDAEMSGSRQFELHPPLTRAEMRLLIKQNAAWAEKTSERQLARERVDAILKRRQLRAATKIGYEDEDDEVDIESELPYDTFVQDPFNELEVQADMAY